jgi:ribosome biogenesis GTPase
VGKSSLLNALMGSEVMEVKAIREDDAKGRHTTTRRQLVTLPGGACIIDTPGMRELGLWDASEGLSGLFSDIEDLLGACRFSDCRHQTEPGCAIRAAIENGELPPKRWERYNKLKREALHAEDKIAAIREKSARNQHIAVWSRQRRKDVW